MKILIDNGHGVNTQGKRSPDGKFLEWAYVRKVAACVSEQLLSEGYDVELVVPENEDISLKERCQRINKWCTELGSKNCVSVSIHCNAGPVFEWSSPKGWSVFVGLNASDNSKHFADLIADEAIEAGLKIRKPLPNQKYWEQSLAMCRDTKCPAILTENLFMTNKDDVSYLNSEEGFNTIVSIHVNAIKAYVSEKESEQK